MIQDKLTEGTLKASYGKKLFAFFKRFVMYLKDEKVIDFTPPWLERHDDKYTFKIPTTEPKILPLDVVRKILKMAPPRVRLSMLLILNCGFGSSEIGRLKTSEYDPVKGTITHKRIKTKEHGNVPKVTYRLWGRTKESLDQQLELQKSYPQYSEHREYLLLNENGNPLWSERIEGKHKKNDNITCQFKRYIGKLQKTEKNLPKCTFYMFRRTSGTLVFNSEKYSHLDWLFLGHAPNTTARQHYTVALEGILDQCLAWLEWKIFHEHEATNPGQSNW